MPSTCSRAPPTSFHAVCCAMLPWFLAETSALAAVLRNLSPSDLVSMAATNSRVRDALAIVLLEMASGRTELPIWLPMSGSVRTRILDAKRRVGIDDTPSPESGSPDSIAAYATASASMTPVPEVDWRGDGTPMIDHGMPFLIRGWVASQRWPAATDWAPSALYRRHGEAMLRCGEDGDGRDVRLRVADMLRHCLSRRSSASTPISTPLYLYDHEFDQQAPALLEGYSAPSQALVDGDLMELIQERPPWRWFALGTAGAGLDASQDPAHTSSWTAGVHGTQRWAILHPSLTSREVGEGLLGDEEPTWVWFCHVLPKIAAAHPGKVFVVDAPAGSLLHVPPRWWHATWIISPVSVAVTHNYVTWGALYECWQHILETQEERHCRHRHILFALSEAFGLTGSVMAAEWLRAIAAAARGRGRPPPASSAEVLRAYDEETGSALLQPGVAWREEDNAILTGMTGQLSRTFDFS